MMVYIEKCRLGIQNQIFTEGTVIYLRFFSLFRVTVEIACGERSCQQKFSRYPVEACILFIHKTFLI